MGRRDTLVKTMPRIVKSDRARRTLTAAGWLGVAVLFTGCGIRIQTYSIDDEPFEQGDHEIIVAEEGSLVPPPGEFPRDATADREVGADGTTSDDDNDSGSASADDAGNDVGDDDDTGGDASDDPVAGDAPATAVDQTQLGDVTEAEFI